jgi:pyruvate formate lyase activating enzyme
MQRRGFIKGTLACAGIGMFAPETLALAPSASMRTPLMLDTKRMAIHDGPGMRTTFFVKGCPLKCIWCHNPESIKSEKQIARFKHLCRNCAKCTMDEATCPTRAFKVYGKKWTMDDLVAKALEDKPFYERSGGGVTLSGGEPLFYWDWAAEFFAACKKAGLKTCLDTSLYAPPAAIAHLLPVTDMWLPDYKVEDDALHVKFTGVSNKVIKRNLEQLVAAKVPLEVRMLVVPGCTDGADLAARRRYVKSLGIPDAQIVELEYHDYARSKYLALGIPDTMPPA